MCEHRLHGHSVHRGEQGPAAQGEVEALAQEAEEALQEALYEARLEPDRQAQDLKTMRGCMSAAVTIYIVCDLGVLQACGFGGELLLLFALGVSFAELCPLVWISEERF